VLWKAPPRARRGDRLQAAANKQNGRSQISLRMRPGFVLAHRYLARIYGRIGRSDLASRHRDEVARLLEMRAPQPMAD